MKPASDASEVHKEQPYKILQHIYLVQLAVFHKGQLESPLEVIKQCLQVMTPPRCQSSHHLN